MADKYAAKGAALYVGDGALPSPSWTLIPSFRDGSQSGGEAERIDVTTHDSPGGRREFVAGFKGESSYAFDIIYDPADAAHENLAALYESGEVVGWRLVLPDAASSEITFDGYVSNFPIPGVPVAGELAVSVTLQITGDINLPSGS